MEIYEPDYTNIGNTAKLRMTAKIFNKWLIKDMSKRANWYKEDTTRDMLAISDGQVLNGVTELCEHLVDELHSRAKIRTTKANKAFDEGRIALAKVGRAAWYRYMPSQNTKEATQVTDTNAKNTDIKQEDKTTRCNKPHQAVDDKQDQVKELEEKVRQLTVDSKEDAITIEQLRASLMQANSRKEQLESALQTIKGVIRSNDVSSSQNWEANMDTYLDELGEEQRQYSVNTTNTYRAYLTPWVKFLKTTQLEPSQTALRSYLATSPLAVSSQNRISKTIVTFVNTFQNMRMHYQKMGSMADTHWTKIDETLFKRCKQLAESKIDVAIANEKPINAKDQQTIAKDVCMLVILTTGCRPSEAAYIATHRSSVTSNIGMATGRSYETSRFRVLVPADFVKTDVAYTWFLSQEDGDRIMKAMLKYESSFAYPNPPSNGLPTQGTDGNQARLLLPIRYYFKSLIQTAAQSLKKEGQVFPRLDRYTPRSVRCLFATRWVHDFKEREIFGMPKANNPLQHTTNAITIATYADKGSSCSQSAVDRIWMKFETQIRAVNKPDNGKANDDETAIHDALKAHFQVDTMPPGTIQACKLWHEVSSKLKEKEQADKTKAGTKRTVPGAEFKKINENRAQKRQKVGGTIDDTKNETKMENQAKVRTSSTLQETNQTNIEKKERRETMGNGNKRQDETMGRPKDKKDKPKPGNETDKQSDEMTPQAIQMVVSDKKSEGLMTTGGQDPFVSSEVVKTPSSHPQNATIIAQKCKGPSANDKDVSVY